MVHGFAIVITGFLLIGCLSAVMIMVRQALTAINSTLSKSSISQLPPVTKRCPARPVLIMKPVRSNPLRVAA
jgi:uncharacterized protein YcfL